MTRKKSRTPHQKQQTQKRKKGSESEDDMNSSKVFLQSNSPASSAIVDNSDIEESFIETVPEIVPETIPSKMASNSASSGQPQTDASKLDAVLLAIADMRDNQDSLKRMFESKLDKIRHDLITNIDVKVRALKEELSLDLARESTRIDSVVKTLETMQIRLDSAGPSTNNSNSTEHSSPRQPRTARSYLADPEICVVASGIPRVEGEDPLHIAQTLINALGNDVSENVYITGAERMPNRINGRPELVKISFQNVQEKVKVLRQKFTLKDTDNYKRVYLNSFKTHSELLIERNARMMVRNMPNSNNYWVDSQGRIRERRENDQTSRRNNDDRDQPE